jgi:hypothetical protein
MRAQEAAFEKIFHTGGIHSNFRQIRLDQDVSSPADLAYLESSKRVHNLTDCVKENYTSEQLRVSVTKWKNTLTCYVMVGGKSPRTLCERLLTTPRQSLRMAHKKVHVSVLGDGFLGHFRDHDYDSAGNGAVMGQVSSIQAWLVDLEYVYFLAENFG